MKRQTMTLPMNPSKTPRWLLAVGLSLTAGLLPMTVAHAQELRRSATNEQGERGERGEQRRENTSPELAKLKAGIEERLRSLGEDLRRKTAAGEITKEEMEAEYKAAERKMWGHYRKAEVKAHQGHRDGSRGERGERGERGRGERGERGEQRRENTKGV